jgi:lipopolysaccharide export system ATP-binding protein
LPALLGEFGLENFIDARGDSLSGGERRRVEIARAIATEPAFLLLDEPFTGIDPIAVADIQAMIRQLRDRGLGVLITDHQVRETLAIVDRAYILNDGTIEVSGSADDVLNSPVARQFYLGEGFKL